MRFRFYHSRLCAHPLRNFGGGFEPSKQPTASAWGVVVLGPARLHKSYSYPSYLLRVARGGFLAVVHSSRHLLSNMSREYLESHDVQAKIAAAVSKVCGAHGYGEPARRKGAHAHPHHWRHRPLCVH